MRKRSRSHQLSLCLGGIALAAFARQGQAQLAVTGNMSTTPVTYGPALATQTINTQFGDSTYGGVSNGLPDANGSELDAAYGVVHGGCLNLFLAGNVENNGNILNLFIDDGAAGGQNTLNITSNGYAASSMNGSVFSSGFNANLLLDINDYYGTMYVNHYALNATGSANSYLGSMPLSSGIGQGTIGGIGFGLNNTNVSIMGTEGTSTSANASSPDAVKTGVEISIPLADLGNPSQNILVMVDQNGGGDSYLSNQFLPGLPVGTNNLATSTFNFSTTPGQYISIASALPNGTWINPGSGVWGTSTNWVNNNSPSAAYVPHLAGDSATFSEANAPSTVTLDGTYSVGSLSFNDANSYTIAPQSPTVGVLKMDNGSGTATVTDFGGAHTISAPVVLNSNTTVTVVNYGDSVTISGNISGNGGLTANSPGNGKVVLSGTNIYGGGTTVDAGNLQLASAGALPTGTALTLSAQDVPSGVLDLNGNNATVSSITVTTGSQTIPTGAYAQIINTSSTAGTATFTYAGTNGNPSTFTGKINDSGPTGNETALTVASGSLTLTNSNTYAGATTINSGGHLIASYSYGGETTGFINPLPATGAIVNNGTLEISGVLPATPPPTSIPATLGTVSGSGTTTVDANMVVDVGNFSQAGGLVNNGSTEIDGNGAVGTISGGGALTIGNGSTPNTLQLAHNSGGSSMGSLTISGSSVLDINNNHLIINFAANGFPDPITTIAAYIKSGYNGGNWNGPGIISSVALTNASGLLYGVGYADGSDGVVTTLTSGQVEVMYTLLGDANLDGLVNGSDFNILAANFNKSITGWDQGDFNYDGLVNASDFNALAANFNQGVSGADVSAGDVAALDAFAAANGLSLPTSSVPEPASAAMTVMAGLGILRRRRRR